MTEESFKPDLTPQQMETLGVLGPQYFEANAKEHNYFGVNASMKKWPSKWIDEKSAPMGWFEWYKGYHSGKRTADDERQIKRWKSFKARHLAQLKKADPSLKDLTVQPRRRQALLNWGIAPGLNVDKALKTARTQKQMSKEGLQKLADYSNTLNSVTDPKSSFNTLQGSTSGGALGAALGNILERRTGKKMALPMALAGGTSGGLIAHKASKESRKDQENFRTQVMDAIQKQSSMNNKYLDKIAESSEPTRRDRYRSALHNADRFAAEGSLGGTAGAALASLITRKKPGKALSNIGAGSVFGTSAGLGYGALHGYRKPGKKYEEESKNQEKSAQVLEKLAKAPTIKKSHKGLLHKKLGIPEDQEIPLSKLRAAKAKAKKNGDKKLEQEATFAINAKTKWGK